MKKKLKIFVAIFCLLLTTLFSSSCLISAGLVIEEEVRRESHRMECALIGEPQMTVTQNEKGVYEVTVDFVLENQGSEDCYDWDCTISIYDEKGCLLDAVSVYSAVGAGLNTPLKMGEETTVQVDGLESYCRPVSVKVWDICIYEEYCAIIK